MKKLLNFYTSKHILNRDQHSHRYRKKHYSFRNYLSTRLFQVLLKKGSISVICQISRLCKIRLIFLIDILLVRLILNLEMNPKYKSQVHYSSGKIKVYLIDLKIFEYIFSF